MPESDRSASDTTVLAEIVQAADQILVRGRNDGLASSVAPSRIPRPMAGSPKTPSERMAAYRKRQRLGDRMLKQFVVPRRLLDELKQYGWVTEREIETDPASVADIIIELAERHLLNSIDG